MIRHFWLPPMLMFLLTFSAAAQVVAPAAPAETPATQADTKKDQNEQQNLTKDPCQEKETTSPSITRILVGSGRDTGKVAWSPQDSTVNPVELSQWLTIEGCRLDDLANKAKAANKSLQLYLNGMPLAGVEPVLLKTDYKISGVRFELRRTDESKDTWAALLGKPKQTEIDDVKVSLGVADCKEGCADITNPVAIHLVAIRKDWLFFFFAVLLLIAVVLVWLAVTRGLLRDRGPGTPWSLARTQMAWWTFFVVGSFLFIWMVTGNYSSLTNSVLSLIGISTGTALLGAIMDDSKEKQIEQRARLAQEETQLRTAIAAGGPNVQQDQTRLDQVLQQLREIPEIKIRQPMNFGLDILSDEDGVSFHRYQIVIWTLVLTTIFLVRVYTTLSMPDFDAQLLGLTGISAGTYLGFKFPEKAT